MAKEWLNAVVSGMPAGFPIFFIYLKAVLPKMLVNLGIDFSGGRQVFLLLTCNC